MKVWLITIGEPLPIRDDVRKLRTSYLADELLSRGHSILWWTSAFDHFTKTWTFLKDTKIGLSDRFSLIALKGRGYRKNISLSRILDHRLVAKKFKRLSRQQSLPDAIIVSLPTYDLAYEAVKFAKQYKLPILVDIRDKWPDIFLQKIPMPKMLSRTLLYSEFNKLKKAVTHSSHLVAVSDSFMQWGLANANRESNLQDKIFYLGYKKSPVDDSLLGSFRDELDKIKHKFVVVFIGTFEEFHDPSNLIECARLLQHQESIQFVLAGDGKLMDRLKEKARDLPNLWLAGWLNQSQINALLSLSHVGVCTTNSKEDLFPNKAFAYLAYGLPVLSSFQGDLPILLKQHQAGFYCEPTDFTDMVKCIELLHKDPDLYASMKQHAVDLFSEKLDGNLIYKQYADHIERVIAN